jgi:hypothetical protein
LEKCILWSLSETFRVDPSRKTRVARFLSRPVTTGDSNSDQHRGLPTLLSSKYVSTWFDTFSNSVDFRPLDCHARSCNTLYLPSQNTPALASWYTSSPICFYCTPEKKLVSVRCWALEPRVCTLSDVVTQLIDLSHTIESMDFHSETWEYTVRHSIN